MTLYTLHYTLGDDTLRPSTDPCEYTLDWALDHKRELNRLSEMFSAPKQTYYVLPVPRTVPRYRIVCRMRGVTDYPSGFNGGNGDGDATHAWADIVALWHAHKLATDDGFYVVVAV